MERLFKCPIIQGKPLKQCETGEKMRSANWYEDEIHKVEKYLRQLKEEKGYLDLYMRK